MQVLKFNQVIKSYLNKDIITIEQLVISQNQRIGIIGRNGQGKSTLLNLLSGVIEPDRGEIQRSIDFQYYRQIAEVDEQGYEQMDPELLARLQVPQHETKHFSGGEEARFRLAEIFSGYEMGLLLDEPTTHLDAEGVDFLIEELRYYYGTLVVVSHDRKLLNELVDTIWEVENGNITVYEGNYNAYLEQKNLHRLEQQRAYEQFIKEKGRLEQAAQKKQEQAQKMANVSKKQQKKNIKPNRLDSTKQKDTVQKAAHKTAKAIEKRMDQLQVVDPLQKEKNIQFPVAKELELHNKFPIMGSDVTIQKGERLLLEKVDFQFPLGKRIGLVGPNGSGKSSLLQHILESGEGVTLSPKVVFSLYKQMAYKFSKEQSLLEYLAENSDYPEPTLRAILSNLGFSQLEITKSITKLSGGEATRLAIAKLFSTPSNVLILDEPTNFIDLQTMEALETLMKHYPGTILFTSHDDYFMSEVAEQIWEISNQNLRLRRGDHI